MKKRLLYLALALVGAPLLWGQSQVVCTTSSPGTVIAACGGAAFSSPVTTDPVSATGVWSFDNAANTPVTFSDGASGTNLTGTTSVCSVGAPGVANSMCLGSGVLSGEGATAGDGFQTNLGVGNATADGQLTFTGTATGVDMQVTTPANTELRLTQTLPASPSTTASGLNLAITGAGSAAQQQRALNVPFAAGYTGASFSMAGFFSNANASTGTGLEAAGTYGIYAAASAGTQAVGIQGKSTAGATTGIGVLGYEGGIATTGYGGFFAANPSTGVDVGVAAILGSALPTVSADVALLADNVAAASPIFIARDNGTAVFTIGDGGTLTVAPLALTASTMTAETTGRLATATHSYTWTNAQVVALGAALTGDINVATLPAKTQVLDALVVITGQGAGTTTLTVSCGDAIGATPFINYVTPSDAKAAVNTVYGDDVAERGTSIDTEFWYLPSYTATTLVTCHYIATGANLDQVTGSTGRVILTTRLLP